MDCNAYRSLPVWGEWIEIARYARLSENPLSLPVWGEWIEITSRLKLENSIAVSPRVGRVD